MQFRTFIQTSLLAGILVAGTVFGEGALRPIHFIDHAEITALTLSPDGEQALATTRRADPDSDENKVRHWLLDTDAKRAPEQLDLPRGARSIAWHPDGERIAWLARADKGPQVHLAHPGSDSPEIITSAPGGVRDFKFGPDGRRLAYSVARPIRGEGVGDESQSAGVEVDVATFGTTQLLSGQLERTGRPSIQTALYLLDLQESEPRVVVPDHTVTGFSFSPEGDHLALTAFEGARRASGWPLSGTDLLILDVRTDEFEVLSEGRDGKDGSAFRGRISHRAPRWSPSGDRIAFLRTDHDPGPAAVPSLLVHDFDSGDTRTVTDSDKTELALSGIAWHKPGRLLLERTHRARKGLYALSVENGTISEVRTAHGDHGSHAFSADGSQAAWVEQSTSRPPEVYFGDPAEDETVQLTRFNDDRAGLSLNPVEQVSWTSTDGHRVHGWLMTPPHADASAPAPLLTVLAGGPGLVLTNRYDFFPRDMWPFPLQVLANRGYSILVVHYRGTNSFGPEFRQFTPGREDVADVRSGVRAMSERPEIDAERLGIMGHSHGAWLAPLAADGLSGVRVASIAEGISNYLSSYFSLEGRRNLDLQEPVLGATPWEDPERYLELSPVFQKRFLSETATLIEAGEKTGAVKAIHLAKALWRHDAPHELVIYPGTGHGIRRPALMLESMQRNLAWFQEHLPVAGSGRG